MPNPYKRLHPYRAGWIEKQERLDSVRYAALVQEIQKVPDNWKKLGWTEHEIMAGVAGDPHMIAAKYGHVVETLFICCGITQPFKEAPALGTVIYIPSTTWLRQRIKYWETFWADKDAS